MTLSTVEVPWAPPGPGTWQPDPVHWPKPVARAAQQPFVEGARRGLAVAFARYGLPFKTIAMAFVNDVLFQQVVGCDPEELERRAVIAEEARADDRWRDDARRWYDEVKPARLSANLALQDTDPSSIDDGSLVAHLRAIVDELERAVAEHMELVSIGDVVGRLLLAGERWGVAAAEMMALLAGSSPGSAEAASSAARIAARLDGATSESLAAAREKSAEVAAAIDEHLRLHGWRMLDTYGPDGTTLAEQPELLLRTVSAAARRASDDLEARESAIRHRFPAADQAQLATLLADARAAYGVRDDNEGLTLLWPMGLLRRALLAVTERFAADAFVLSVEEIEGLARGLRPEAAVIDERRRLRAAAAQSIPSTLGDAGEGGDPELPAGILPTLAAAEAVWGAEYADGAIGIGAAEPYVGRACVCVDAATSLDDLQPGDVLITTTTTSAINAVLAIAGALVVEFGGPASHAALVARELGIPAVLGVVDATTRYRTGDVVIVDALHATVRIA